MNSMGDNTMSLVPSRHGKTILKTCAAPACYFERPHCAFVCLCVPLCAFEAPHPAGRVVVIASGTSMSIALALAEEVIGGLING